jgi:hypothetical protein
MSKRKVEKKNRRKTLKNIGGMNLFGKKKRLPTLLSSSEARAILQPISILVSEGYIETPTPYIVSPQESSPLSGVSRYLPALPADVLSSGYEMNKLAVLLSMLAYAKTGATTTVPVVCGEPIFDEFNDNFLNMELVYFDGLTEMSFQIGQVPFEITMVKTNDYDDDDKKISVFDVLNALYHAYKKNNDNPGEEITSSIDRNSDSSLKNDPELNEELKKLLGEEKGKNRSATAPVSYTELNTVSPSYLSEPVSTVITSPVAPPRPPPPTTAKAQPLSPISTTAETPPRDTSPVSEKTVYTAPTPRDTSPVSDAVNSSNIITPIDRPKLPFLKEINKTETQGIEGIKSTENTLPENKKNDLLNQLQKVKLKSINGKKTTDNPESEQKFNSEMVDKVKEDFLRKELNNKIQNVKKPDDDSDDESDDDSDDDPDKWQGGAQSVGSYDVFVSHPIKDWMTAVCLFLSQADSQLRLIVSPFISPDIQMKRKTDFEKKTNRFLFFLNFLFELHQAIIIDPTTDPFFIDSSIQKSIAETLAKLKACKIILEQETESYNFEFNNVTFINDDVFYMLLKNMYSH